MDEGCIGAHPGLDATGFYESGRAAAAHDVSRDADANLPLAVNPKVSLLRSATKVHIAKDFGR